MVRCLRTFVLDLLNALLCWHAKYNIHNAAKIKKKKSGPNPVDNAFCHFPICSRMNGRTIAHSNCSDFSFHIFYYLWTLDSTSTDGIPFQFCFSTSFCLFEISLIFSFLFNFDSVRACTCADGIVFCEHNKRI